jgi:hypothetical protein
MLGSVLFGPSERRKLNETLQRALFQAGLDDVTVAARLGVDPKTVRRWLDGRMPYPRLRWQLATLLGSNETDLWPELAAARNANARPDEVVAVYPHRRSIERDVWCQFFSSATTEIAILAYSSIFIAEDAGIVHLLRTRAVDGVRVRLALGDPDSPHLANPAAVAGIDATTAAGIRRALSLYQPLLEVPNTEIRLHRAVLYNSIYQSDHDMLVSQHAYGLAEADSPVVHLRSDRAGGMASDYLHSLDCIWQSANTRKSR